LKNENTTCRVLTSSASCAMNFGAVAREAGGPS
jgi:hypothetical protein